MQTKRFQPNQIDEAARLIQQGECVAFQTETVYGLGADATNEEAVKKIYQAKGRPSDNPLIVHVSSIDQAHSLAGQISSQADLLMKSFWPGPLTVIVAVKEGILAPAVTAGLETVALRMPDSPVAQALIRQSRRPIAAPSANRSGKPSPTSASHVLHDLNGRIAGIIDSGPAQVGVESTIIDTTAQPLAVILRPGGISREAIEKVVGPVAVSTETLQEKDQPKAPGMKYQHYSPDEDLYIVDGTLANWKKWMDYFYQEGYKPGVLASKECVDQLGDEAEAVFSLGSRTDTSQAASRLFEGLRYFESTAADVILAQAYPTSGLGAAYMNRLEKAAAYKYL